MAGKKGKWMENEPAGKRVGRMASSVVAGLGAYKVVQKEGRLDVSQVVLTVVKKVDKLDDWKGVQTVVELAANSVD